MVWTTGTASGGSSSTGLGGTPAQVGFNAGNSINYFAVDESRTTNIVNIDQMSNVNIPGKFIFRIDTERIESGGCNTEGTLTVTPRYGTMLGGQRIHIGGPCVTADDKISVKYGNFDQMYNCTRENDFKVTCVTPMFYRTGDSMNHAKVEPAVHRYQPKYWKGRDSHFVSWEISNIPFQAHFISLDVFYLQEHSGNLKWIHGGCLKCNVSIHELEQSIVVFPETYVAAIRLTPVGDGIIWEREGVWSDIFSIVPRTNQMSEQLCSSWHAEDLNSISRSHTSDSGFGRQCCYDNMGNLIGYNDPSDAGTLHRYNYLGDNDRNIPFLSNFYFDIVPRQQCCLYASNNENNIVENNSCRKYLERRPASDCRGYQPPRPAFVYGDPHLKTADGLSYTFNGFGEFLLLQDTINGLKAQVRLEQAVNDRGVKMPGTLVTSFVVRIVNFTDVVEVQLNSIRVADVLINGVIADFTDIHWIDYTGVSILFTDKNSSKEFLVMIQHPKISCNITATKHLLNIMTIFGDESFKGNISGLLGNYDGNPDNDLKPRNGNASCLLVNSSLESIHEHFGETWRITEEESLFKYPIGKTYFTYIDPTFVPSFAEQPVADNRTKEICGNSENCIFDIHTTGVTEVAVSTKETVEVIEEMGEIFQPNFIVTDWINRSNQTDVVTCGFPPTTKSGVWNYTGLTEGNTAILTCNDKVVIVEEIIECQSNGKWTDVKVSCIHGTSQIVDGSKYHGGIDKTVVFAIIGCVSAACVALLMCVSLRCYMKRKENLAEKSLN